MRVMPPPADSPPDTSNSNSASNLSQTCPVRNVLDRIGDRWSLLVLLTLAAHGELRFNALKRTISDISQRMLAQTVRDLECDGYLIRTVRTSVPPQVAYRLSPLGQTLVDRVKPLVAWADEHHDAVRAARSRYAMAASES